MPIVDLLIPEYDQEMASTRKVLERVPDDKLEWKPHPKSNSIGWVASHLVEIPGWVEGTLTQEAWDIHPVGSEPYRTPLRASRQEILEEFDAAVASGRKALAATSDEALMKEWSLLAQGKPLMTMPRYSVIRSFILNHSIHHRAFLCSYLRLNDIPIPGMYGPSGDPE
jgi:uncharacterized damage-inducible protein DinB